MRDAPRLHVEAELAGGVEFTLDADRSHYLLHVMRARAGDPVRVFNAAAGEWRARIADGPGAGKRTAVLQVEEQTRPPAVQGFAPLLLFALLKRDATDTAVRMATELGAGAIRPVLTRRTVGDRVNLARLGLIAREAAEQCERLDVPPIGAPLTLPALLEGWDRDVALAVALERTGATPLGARAAGAAPGAVLIGPEGGWAPDELVLLGRAAFVQPVSLGALVLRAETAAAAALAVLAATWGWGGVADVEPG